MPQIRSLVQVQWNRRRNLFKGKIWTMVVSTCEWSMRHRLYKADEGMTRCDKFQEWLYFELHYSDSKLNSACIFSMQSYIVVSYPSWSCLDTCAILVQDYSKANMVYSLIFPESSLFSCSKNSLEVPSLTKICDIDQKISFFITQSIPYCSHICGSITIATIWLLNHHRNFHALHKYDLYRTENLEKY